MLREHIAIAVVALTVSATAQDATLKRIGYWGASFRGPRSGQSGAEVSAVRPDSAAARINLHEGDRVLRVNGRSIATGRDLDDYLYRFREGDTVSAEISRGGAVRTERISLPPLPVEQFEHATVSHESVTSPLGDRVRVIVTRPAGASQPVPAVFFVGWLSCDSVEYPFGETDGFGAIIRRIVDRSGYATVRVDKPGVGDSEGPACSAVDYTRELAAYRAAFASMNRFALIDASRLFVLGISNGGGFAPAVVDIANGAGVRGYIAAGSWGRSWYEHMLEHERRRLMREARALDQLDASVKAFADFYSLFLVKKMSPGAILREHPAWRPLWYDADDGMYGRPAAFYQQLQDLDVAALWAHTNAPALILRGGADTVMSRNDSEALADIVNKARPGTATYREIDGADHLFARRDGFAGETVETIIEWMRSHS